MKRYFSLYQEDNIADIHIYGDITSWEWDERDVSSYTLSQRLQELNGVENINVYINSYGGEVAEGLAIYNALKRHKAKITTYVDGFACSIASVIFAAGDERVMTNTALLMIHNAWTWATGDSNDLRKQADDLEKITQASINAYMEFATVSEEEIKEMMNRDTWLTGTEALELGFVTEVEELSESEVASQSVRRTLMNLVTKEPEKVAVVNANLDEGKLEEIVKNSIVELKQELEEEQEQEQEQEENKPLNMMRALFNLEGED